MPIYINGKAVTAIKRNGADYCKVYHGEELVWSKRKKNEYAELWEWLKGDGSAYINTGIETANSISVKGKCKIVNLIHNTGIYGARYIVATNKMNAIDLFLGSTNLIIEDFYENINSRLSLTWFVGIVNFSNSREFRTINDNTKSTVISTAFDHSLPMYVFSANQIDTTGQFNDMLNFDGMFSYFDLLRDDTYVMQLAPCQLIKELPASKAWDGNSHSAGECGMWDSVSDKFYGNAASSGSFSVSDED